MFRFGPLARNVYYDVMRVLEDPEYIDNVIYRHCQPFIDQLLRILSTITFFLSTDLEGNTTDVFVSTQ